MVRLGDGSTGGGNNDGGGGGDDGEEKKGNDKKGRPSTPAPISEVGDNENSAEITPEIISTFIASRFQQEVGDEPSELVLSANITTYGRPDDGSDADVSHLGAGAAAAPQPLRRQPTPEEAERYRDVARQLNDVAQQIEREYSGELDSLVDSLNLVSEVAYDAFAAVAGTIISKGITWSRVVVLILFGWRVMKKVYLTWSTSGIIQRILDYILKFITDHVLAWILSRGGWMNLLRNSPTSGGETAAAVVNPTPPTDFAQFTTAHAAIAAIACAALAYLAWTRRS